MTGDDWSKWVAVYVGAYVLGSISFAYLFGKMKGVDIRQHGSGNTGATNAGRVLGRRWGVACFLLDCLKGVLPPVVAGLWLGLYPSSWAMAPDQVDTAAVEHLLWIGSGVVAVIGHMHSMFLGFRGGKGVATGFGCLVAIYPHLTIPAFGALIVWAVALRISRMMSLASMVAAASLPVLYLALLVVRNLTGESVDAVAGGAAMPAPVSPAPATGPVPAAAPASSAGLLDGLDTGWPFLVVTGILAGVIVWKHRSNMQRILAGTEPKIGAPRPPMTPSSPTT